MKYFFTYCLLFTGLLVFAQDSLNMRKLGHWDNPEVPIESSTVGLRYNEVWGWASPVTGREYAVIGATTGAYIVDVSDPTKPFQADFVPGRRGNVINRDYKSKGNYVFALADQELGSLQVWDMSTLPDSVHVVYDGLISDANGVDTFNLSHNMFVEGDRLYIVTPKNLGQTIAYGYGVMDISNPEKPVLIKLYPESVFGRVHASYVRHDTAYIHAGGNGLFIADMHDLDNPIVLAHVQYYAYYGYNHTGWLNDEGTVYIMADETRKTPVKVMDMTDKTDPEFISYLYPRMNLADTNSIPHNQFWVGQYGINSYYYDGVQIFDLSDPYKPQIAGYYDTYPQPYDGKFKGCWGVYPFLPSKRILASDMQTGLYILEFSPFAKSQEANTTVVYPNPISSEVLQVKINNPVENLNVRIYDMVGKEILVQKATYYTSEMTIFMPNIATGMYILQAFAGGNLISTQKIQVQH